MCPGWPGRVGPFPTRHEPEEGLMVINGTPATPAGSARLGGRSHHPFPRTPLFTGTWLAARVHRSQRSRARGFEKAAASMADLNLNSNSAGCRLGRVDLSMFVPLFSSWRMGYERSVLHPSRRPERQREHL